MRSKRTTLKYIMIAGLAVMIFTMASCDVRLKSDREVEQRLQEMYGIPFEVISSDTLPGSRLREDVYRARVYVAAPKDDPDNQFFVFSTVTGERGGVPGFAGGMLDTFEFEPVKTIMSEMAEDAGLTVSFQYDRYPLTDAEETYYSRMDIEMDADPQNLDLICETISAAVDRILLETKLDFTGLHAVTLYFVLWYREEGWPENKVCRIEFNWDYNLNWNEAEQAYKYGPLDYSVDGLRQTARKEIEDHKDIWNL